MRAPYEDSSDEGSSYSASLSTLAIHHNILSEDDMFQFLAQSAAQDLAIPSSHAQGMTCAEAKFWKEAERIELEALKEKETFARCTDIPLNRKPFRSSWVYSKKFDENNNLVKFKARKVAKGYTQVCGED